MFILSIFPSWFYCDVYFVLYFLSRSFVAKTHLFVRMILAANFFFFLVVS